MNKQVAEWLRESAVECEDFRDWLKSTGRHAFAMDKDAQGVLFRDRAAQVEAMTCDGCKHWLITIHPEYGIGLHPIESECEKINIKGAGEKFCCIHWEERE